MDSLSDTNKISSPGFFTDPFCGPDRKGGDEGAGACTERSREEKLETKSVLFRRDYRLIISEAGNYTTMLLFEEYQEDESQCNNFAVIRQKSQRLVPVCFTRKVQYQREISNGK